MGDEIPLQSIDSRGSRASQRIGKASLATFEIRIVSGVVSKDHVHIMVSAPPTMAASEIMRRIKGNTASRLFEEFPHLKKRYWGRHFWARGYFCATVGQMTEEMIKQYLEHHFEPNTNDSFKVEPP
jgi:putative transposase